MIVMVTNCIGYGVDIPSERLWRGAVQHSLLTDGLLRLLGGRPFAPAGHWDHRYTFEPIRLAEVEAIVWSPFIDQTGCYPLIRCRDGSRYPWSDTPMVEAVGNGERPSLDEVYGWWTAFDQLTARVPTRLLVLYPDMFLDAATPEHARHRERVLESTPVALTKFSSWQHLTVEQPEIVAGYWAHFTEESRAELLHQISSAVA